jgi:hypothetical protein
MLPFAFVIPDSIGDPELFCLDSHFHGNDENTIEQPANERSEPMRSVGFR